MLSRDEKLKRLFLFQAQLKKKELELKPLEIGLFAQQKKYDKDPSKRKAALCTRRAGKTHVISKGLLDGIYSKDKGDCAYIGLTRLHAKRIMFNHVIKLQRKYRLDLEANRAELSILNKKTGNTLYITAANHEEDTEKLRGLSLKKIVLDEAASFKEHINYLIDDVLEPTTIDCDGSIEMIGTPSANPLESNIFYRVTQGIEKGWSVHNWSILDNIYIPHAKTWLEDYRIRKNWNEDHPTYLREWCGLWVVDKTSLVYKYDKEKQDFDKLPEGHDYRYIFGIDLGFDDAFAIVVLAFSYTLPNKVYCVDEFKRVGLIPSKMAEQIINFKNKYNPIAMVADTGGLGKAIVEEFKARYSLNIERADKANKLDFIEIVNGDLISGIIKIKDNSDLALEMKQHQWDPESEQRIEDDRTENHMCLVGDSLILTEKGYKRIDQLNVSDKVITRVGIKEIECIAKTGYENIYNLITENSKIQCTNDHLFYSLTRQKFVAFKDLQIGELLWEESNYLQNQSKLKSLTAKVIAGIQTQREGLIEYITKRIVKLIKNLSFYIEKYINIIMEKLKKGFQYIIKTKILLIMISIISKLFVKKNTQEFTHHKNIENRCQKIALKKLFLQHQNGTQAKKVMNGIKSIGKILSEKLEKILNPIAKFAALKQLVQKENKFVQTNVTQKKEEIQELIKSQDHAIFVKKDTKQVNFQNKNTVRVLALEKTGLKQKVYNLQIKDQNEYFVNGILSHNCDSLIYSYKKAKHYLAKPKDIPPKPNTKEYYDKEAQEMLTKQLEQLKKQEEDKWDDII